jgi:hypothetical protein
MPVPEHLPSFDELPAHPDGPPQSGWWLFGKEDQVGKFNLQTPERIVDAARLVRTGEVFALNWELELPSPPLYGRGAVRHTILGAGPGRDDVLDNFFPQASSQWDSLVHVAHPVHGFYNGVTEADITGKSGTRNGIEHWARRGLAGRGVLLDMAAYLASQGRPLDCSGVYRFSVEELEACRQSQGLEIRPGDMLIIHTGWIGWYHEQDLATRRGLTNIATLKTPGVAAGEAMARYLWDLQVCAVASDCPAFEAWPPTPETGGFLHQYIIGLFGMGIGEMWDLRALAASCAADGVYEFFFTSAPLNKLGGVGSPPNALAIK